MTREVVIDAQSKEITIGLLEDKRLAEYQRESSDQSFTVGNIYLAKVKKIMPGLNAAFVDVGYSKEGFIHYQDLGPQFKTYQKYIKQQLSDRKHLVPIGRVQRLPDMPKDLTVSDVLTAGDEILVQVAKEPISTKGPRLTSDISIPGRFMVLIPFQNKVSISQKIRSSSEKVRLRQILQSIRPQNYGIIVRTSAEGKQVEELQAELTYLVHRWESAMSQLQKGVTPTLCYEETSRVVALLRDIFNPSFENIWVNDSATFTQIKDYVRLIAPEKADIVRLYDGDQPILDHFNVTRQIKSSARPCRARREPTSSSNTRKPSTSSTSTQDTVRARPTIRRTMPSSSISLLPMRLHVRCVSVIWEASLSSTSSISTKPSTASSSTNT